MISDLRAELMESLDEAEWEWLIPHVQRDAVILVALELNLVDVGVAIANDNTASVQQWISEQLISKPTTAQVGEWNGDPLSGLPQRHKRFTTLIVQPYVLVQEIITA